MFVNIDDTYFIKKKVTQKKLHECISFISNQKNIENIIVERAYKNNILKIILLPHSINEKDIDIVIKTKFNKDYKFINLDNKQILCESTLKINPTIKKINRFNLNKIKFFPETYISGKIVYQKLAKGNYFRPNNLSEFSRSLLKNLADVINNLSSLNKSNIKISTYLKDNNFRKKEDDLNFKIINIFFLILKKYHNKNIALSLTHGDFKFEHLFLLKNKLEYIIDWDTVDIRSIFFDVMNFFMPWFTKRSYNYFQIKRYILKYIDDYVPNLQNEIKNKYDIYFSIYALERYKRIHNCRTFEFDVNMAYKRYNSLFKNIIMEVNSEYQDI